MNGTLPISGYIVAIVLVVLLWSTISIQDVMAAATTTTTVEARIVNGAHLHPPIRCWGDSLSTFEMFDGDVALSPEDILKRLSGSPCGLCDPRKAIRAPKTSDPDDRYHALLIFPKNAPEFIPLATGLLLTNRFRITILRLHFESEDDNGTSAFERQTGQTVDGKLREIHERIVTGIPCDHQVRTLDDASYVLEVTFSLKEQNRFSVGEKTCQGPISHEPFDACAIRAAPGTAALLKNYVPLSDQKTSGSNLPDVLITDASLVGSMWMAEAWGIPAVAIAGSAFIPLAVEHDAAWTSQTGSLSKRLWKLLRQRFHSLSITKAYMEMNKMRLDFGLPPLRKPIDYLGPVSAILMEFAEEDSIPGVDATKAQEIFVEQTEQWERLHVVGPLQPPCIRCEVKPQSSFRSRKQPANTKQSQQPTILLIPPSSPTPTWTRNILQGMIMALQSLGRYDDCDWDSLSCQKPYNNFKIIWLYKSEEIEGVEGEVEEEDFYPPIHIDSVEREAYVSLLDAVTRHPKTILAIMPCDRNAAVLEHMMDISVVCIEETDRFPLKPWQRPPSATEPRELSARILQLLRARQQKEQRAPPKSSSDNVRSPSTQGSLSRSVAIIERVAATHREHYPWPSTAEMQRITTQAVKNLTQGTTNASSTETPKEPTEDEFEWQPYDTFTVFVAWIVLLTSALYITVNDFVTSRSIRRSPNHYLNHIPSSSSDGMFTRPDLDDAWAAWIEWYHEQPDSISFAYHEIFGSVSDAGSQPPLPFGTTSPINSPSNSGHHAKKRKKK